MIEEDLRPLLKGVAVGALFQACFDAINVDPLVITQGNGRLRLESEFAHFPPEVQEKFHGLNSCELSLSEALSLCYLAEYIREKFHKEHKYKYSIPVQIERSFHQNHKLKEYYFGDGMVRWEDESGEWKALPIQETKALNYTSVTNEVIIEDEIVRVINKKTSDAKRRHYNSICGLLVSVMPKASNINYLKILNNISISNYNAVYLVEYSNNFRTGTVIDLLSNKNGQIAQPLSITPNLVRE